MTHKKMMGIMILFSRLQAVLKYFDRIAKHALVFGVSSVFFLTMPAMGSEKSETEANQILQSMSTFMDKLSEFSVKMDIDNEILDLAGQKLQFSSSGEIAIKRPDKLHVNRQGAIADIEFIYDGKILTLHGLNLNVYYQVVIPGSLDTGIDALENELGLEAPGTDLFHTKAFKELSATVAEGVYLGTAYVNGVECYHLAFREAKIDWQLWINAEGDPLPMKYVITTKWLTGAPQYSIRFYEWNTAPDFSSSRFEFDEPKGAEKLETLSFDEIGRPLLKENKNEN